MPTPRPLWPWTYGQAAPPLNVQFEEQAQPANAPITSWVWDFGDGGSASQANPAHTYAPGTYSVSLIITDANGCQDTYVEENAIEVYPDLQVLALPEGPTRTCDPSLQVAWRDSLITSSSGPFTYAWDMGDGSAYEGPNATHTFQEFGRYEVSLTVTDQTTGCSASTTSEDAVQLIGENLQVAVSHVGGCAPLAVELEAVADWLGGRQAVRWDFGDGTVLEGTYNDPAIRNPRHVYEQAGTYTPRLEVNLGEGLCVRTALSTEPIVVSEGAVPAFMADLQASCAVPFDVQFTASTLDAVSWLWEFGDGHTSTEPNPRHTYTEFGTYAVSLTTTNEQGCSQTLEVPAFITAGEVQAALGHNLNDYTFFPPMWDGRNADPIRGGCLPLEITFTDESQSPTPIVAWEWTFGDGASSDEANPVHTYVDEGAFTLSLTIQTEDGCVSTVSCDSCIRAGNPPEARLDTTGYPLLQCCSASSYFINQTEPGTHDYVWYEVTTDDWHGLVINDTTNGDWDFGSTVPVFRDSGQYVSTDFYAYNYGCPDKFELPDWTMLRPPYGSAGIDTFRCESNWAPGVPIQFDTTNALFLLDTTYIDSVLWEFGDPAGTTSNEFYPSILYPDTGAYWITVTTWNFDNGCRCRVSGEQFLQLKALPDTSFSLSHQEGCAPLEVRLDGPTQNVANWIWQIGDQQSQESSPTFVLDTPGTYDVQLGVANADGCGDTTAYPSLIEVGGIKAQLEAEITSGCVPFTLEVRDRSITSTRIVRKHWSFGDGTQLESLDSLQLHTYLDAPLPPEKQAEGIPVVLTLEDETGCTDSDTLWVVVAQPAPAYAVDTLHQCEGDSLYLTAFAGDSIGLGGLRFEWDFVGLDSLFQFESTSRGFLPAGGPHLLRLTVTDSLGCSYTREDSFEVIPRQPAAQFSASPTEAVCPPLLVNFRDESEAGHAPIVRWQWDFGDGSASSLQHPAKIFTRANTYDVRLTVTDSLGCSSETITPDLIRLTGVSGAFDMSTDLVCVGDSVRFEARSPNAGSYTWDFGDGEIGLGPVVTHVYRQAATNYPTLLLKDSTELCAATVVDTLSVHPAPPLRMPADTAFCEGGQASLNVQTEGVEYLWSTGASTPNVLVERSGTYAVTLTYPETGCQVQGETEVTVWELPMAFLEVEPQICEGDSLLVRVQSPDSLVRFAWNVPPANEIPPLVLLPRQDLPLRMVAWDQNGCSVADSAEVEVVPAPTFDLAYSPLCEGDTLELDGNPTSPLGAGGQLAWFGPEGNLLGRQPLLRIARAGDYELRYQLRGCETRDTVEVIFHPLPLRPPSPPQLNCVYRGNPVQLDAGDYARYYWEHDGGRAHWTEVVDTGVYYVQVFNEFGCLYRDSLEVVDACPPLLYVPNAFTPNGDGQNDLFGYDGEYFQDFEITVFNRWGHAIYRSRDPEAFWDGRFRGSEVPEGVYVYLIRYRGTHPDYLKTFLKRGTVTLIR